MRIPETYWVGTDVRELYRMRHLLPNRFVLKPNHSSGRFRLLDSSEEVVDWDDLIAAGDRWVKRDEEELVYGHYGYKLARHLLIAEERVGGGPPPATLRAFVANEKVLLCSYTFGTIHPDNPVPRVSFRFDGELNRVQGEVYGNAAAPSDRCRIEALSQHEKRQLLDTVLALAKPLEQIRVDLYVEESFWFGELTAYNSGGLAKLPRPYTEPVAREWALPDLSKPDLHEDDWLSLLEAHAVGSLQVR